MEHDPRDGLWLFEARAARPQHAPTPAATPYGQRLCEFFSHITEVKLCVLQRGRYQVNTWIGVQAQQGLSDFRERARG